MVADDLILAPLQRKAKRQNRKTQVVAVKINKNKWSLKKIKLPPFAM